MDSRDQEEITGQPKGTADFVLSGWLNALHKTTESFVNTPSPDCHIQASTHSGQLQKGSQYHSPASLLSSTYSTSSAKFGDVGQRRRCQNSSLPRKPCCEHRCSERTRPVLTDDQVSSQGERISKHPLETALLTSTPQELKASGQCSCNVCHKDSRPEDECSSFQQLGNSSLKLPCPHFRHCVYPEVDYGSTRKYPWLETLRSDNCNISYQSVCVCSCSDCRSVRVRHDNCTIEFELKDNPVAHQQHGERTCISNLPKVRCESRQNCEGVQRTNLDSHRFGTRDKSCSQHTCGTIFSCICCQQQRLLPTSPSQNRQSKDSQRQFLSRYNSDQSFCLLQNTNHYISCLPEPSVPPQARPYEIWYGSCFSRLKTRCSRMWHMRYVGRCLLLLLLTGLSGLVAHISIADYKTGHYHGWGDVIDGSGGGPTQEFSGEIHPDWMRTYLKPVPFREFQEKLHTARNKLDLVRIFLIDQNISDISLKALLADLAESPTKARVQHNLNKQGFVSSSVSDKSFVTVPQSHVERDVAQTSRASDDKESNVHLSKLKAKEPLLKLGNRAAIKNVIPGKDSFSSVDDLSRREKSLRALSNPIKNRPASAKVLHSSTRKPAVFQDLSFQNIKKRSDTPRLDQYSDDEEDFIDGEMDYSSDQRRADTFLEREANPSRLHIPRLASLRQAEVTDDVMEALEAALHHIDEVENNPPPECRHPQPQVVRILDPRNRSRNFFPDCIVIHRCLADSGCCADNFMCSPKTERTVMMAFMVVNRDLINGTVTLSQRMVERIPLINHTECECREKPRLPTCTQRCPGEFRMYRYGYKCVCDCLTGASESATHCNQVKDGLIGPSADDLQCIRSGECAKPACSIGEFDVASGSCPLKDSFLLTRQREEQILHQMHQKSVGEGSGDL